MSSFLEQFTRAAGTLYLPPQTDLTGWPATPFQGNGSQLVAGPGPWGTYAYDAGFASRDINWYGSGYYSQFVSEGDASEWWRFYLSPGSPGPYGTGQIKVWTGSNVQAWVTVEWSQSYGVTVRDEGETIGSQRFVERISTTAPSVIGLRWGEYGNYLAVELDGIVVGSVATWWQTPSWNKWAANYTPTSWAGASMLPITFRVVQPYHPDDIVNDYFTGTPYPVLDAMMSWWPWTGGDPVATVRPPFHQRRNDTLALGGAWRRTMRTQQAGSLWRRAPL